MDTGDCRFQDVIPFSLWGQVPLHITQICDRGCSVTPKGEIEINNNMSYGQKEKPHHWAKIWSLEGPFTAFFDSHTLISKAGWEGVFWYCL